MPGRIHGRLWVRLSNDFSSRFATRFEPKLKDARAVLFYEAGERIAGRISSRATDGFSSARCDAYVQAAGSQPASTLYSTLTVMRRVRFLRLPRGPGTSRCCSRLTQILRPLGCAQTGPLASRVLAGVVGGVPSGRCNRREFRVVETRTCC